MGRINQNPTPLPITHFSHPHELDPIPHNPQFLTLCSGCKLEPSGIMYTCRPCNFTLHTACTQFPHLITHPSHPGCNLTLLPVSSYPGGKFNCDACNRHGDGFSYHCIKCEYDLHVVCAEKPLKITHQAHSCPLDLTFKNPYEAKGFSCDVCRQIGVKQWLYRCSSCEFDVHLDCTMAMPQPSVQAQQFMLQHHSLFPGPTSQNPVAGIPLKPNHLMHSASTGPTLQHQFQAPGASGFVNPPPNNLMHSASIGPEISNPHMGPVNTGFVPTNQYQMVNSTNMVPWQPNIIQPPPRTNGLGSTLMTAAVQGLVEGAFQQVGQSVMQGIIGGGDSGGSGDGYSEY